MQGNTIEARHSRRPQGLIDVIAPTIWIGRHHGSGLALARSLLSMGLVAGGLTAFLLGAGTEVGTAVASTQPTALLSMPKPRVHAPIAEAPAVITGAATFAALHDLDTDLGASTVDRVSYDFLLSQTETGDPNDVLEFGPMRIRRHIVQTILRAAQAVETDPVLLMAVADKESSFITAVQAKTSSATGLFQFIERTWLGVVRDFGPRHGLATEAALISSDGNGKPVITDAAERLRVLDLRRDPHLSALLAGEMLKRDAARIALKIGRNLSLGEIYLAHFLGPDDAENFLSKVVDKPGAAAAVLLPGPARANRSIFFAAGTGRGRRAKKAASLSVAEVHQKFETMMNTRGDRYRAVESVAGVIAAADIGEP